MKFSHKVELLWCIQSRALGVLKIPFFLKNPVFLNNQKPRKNLQMDGQQMDGHTTDGQMDDRRTDDRWTNRQKSDLWSQKSHFIRTKPIFLYSWCDKWKWKYHGLLKFNYNWHLGEYQLSGECGTRSPPEMTHRLQHLTACLIQNGRQGLEISQTLCYLIPWTTFAK